MKNTIRIAFWNILYHPYDKPLIPSQKSRLDNITSTVKSLGSLDAICLSEVQGYEDGTNNGERIAQEIGYDTGEWSLNHREGEHIGVFGPGPLNTEFIDVGDNRTATMTRINGIVIIGVHLTFNLKGSKLRLSQLNRVLELVKDEPCVVVMGDFNSLVVQSPRRALVRAGFTSALSKGRLVRPVTNPAPGFRKYYSKWWHKVVVGRGLSPDDIYVKGLEIVSGNVFSGQSDHCGVTAELRLPEPP